MTLLQDLDMTQEGSAFAERAGRYRRELHVHCYRMLGSFTDAEDLVQETLLRAWHHRDGFDGGPDLRAWLYRIATNACLDAIRRDARRAGLLRSFADVPWLQPYPDRLLDEIAPAESEPDAVVVARQTIELTFLAVIQLLPAQQRAVLVLREVLGWSARETAQTLGTSVTAVNSALQRARGTLRGHSPDRPAGEPSPWERTLLTRYVDAHARCDTEALAALVHDDLRVTMPPHPLCHEGPEALAPLFERAFGPGRAGEWRLLPTMANRHPAAACYLRRPGDTVYRAAKLDVLRVRGDAIAEFTTFGAGLFPAFGLPATLPGDTPAPPTGETPATPIGKTSARLTGETS
ncbi:RNA polymerase subunit sigma-70 [Streptosporangium sp. NPDC050855]|uniref:RNA polymerase subunit sigma-70 n=1 Tax=Streptosporangium sp. NPDC050855 TaxID=3366194 RepID=UPI0037A85C68